MKRRTAQLASNLMRAINEVLARGSMDPRIRGMITVTTVELSEDFKRAKVKVTIYPEEREALTMHGLKAATGRIRRETMMRVRMREMPSLEFMLDEGLKEQAKVLELLAKAREESEARGQTMWNDTGSDESAAPPTTPSAPAPDGETP